MSGDTRSVDSKEPRQLTAGGKTEVRMEFEPEVKLQKPEKEKVEYDEFGLPIAKLRISASPPEDDTQADEPVVDDKHAQATQTTFSATTATTGTVTESETNYKKSHKQGVSTASINSTETLNEEDDKENERKVFAEDPLDSSTANTTKNRATISEWSHMQLVTKTDKDYAKEEEKDDVTGVEWQEMPAFASHDMYDDYGRLIAKEAAMESEDEGDGAKGGASKGYTRVNDDEDAQSATSMDESTNYLFKENDDDEASRNPLSQMQATKELLTEGQRIAYVGVCRLAMAEMAQDMEKLDSSSRSVKKDLQTAKDTFKMWNQKMMIRLYNHMDITADEQIMIEQLAEHGVISSDLTPTLLKNSRVNNPMAQYPSSVSSPRQSSIYPDSPRSRSRDSLSPSVGAPPPYEETAHNELSEVKNPSQLPQSRTIDIDLRWTVLCDLFLVLIADSVYDARSRSLLERVGKMLDVSWLDICKFEKRVTDALEMQEGAEQNWNEEEHMENRRKQARNRRYMMMGLATIGGGLVIGLSGGLLAPVIGAGLAAGFTTIGVAGTGSFLAGTAGTALIASGAVVSGSTIGARASLNRTQSVETFEYRPLHNAKRVNLIITISGWMNGKEDDVRLPFSTVDPVMGDIFSVYWEPEMLRSMGKTINILATEVLTQSLQQVLGSTILMALMASIQLPVVLTKLSYLLDNPWSVSLDRATSAGLILADSLIHRNLGVRPVTLVGYSLGARVIFSCLKELARVHAYGLVQNVYLFGSPVVAQRDEYSRARAVVSGRFVNGYAKNDWILGYLFRATNGGLRRVAGLAPVEDVIGVENVDVTDLVEGHMAYRQSIPKLLRRVGWIVLSDEFSEIEDPDPDQHRERQRELISELDEARKELEKEPKKRKFGFFGRNKDIAKKKQWETYEEVKKSSDSSSAANGTNDTTPKDDVLFDIDAIRAELAKDDRDAQVKEVTANLPQLKNGANSLNVPNSPYSNLRHVKSYDDYSQSSAHASGTYGSVPSLQQSQSHTTRNENGYGYANFNDNNKHRYDSDSEDEFGNRRRRGMDEEIHMTFDSYETREWDTDKGKGTDTGTGTGTGRQSVAVPDENLGRNVWLDEYEDEFGEEGEMTMTFA
ncbi:hypothetical protein RUND412_005561 [Rhizina undulata]